MSLTQQDLPGIYVEFTMHANTDAKIQITLYSEYDEATGTGTVIDLTGASFKARAIDADGNELWSVVPTSAVPASGEILTTVPKATTLLKAETDGEWGLKVIWPDTSEEVVAYGPTLIGRELVN